MTPLRFRAWAPAVNSFDVWETYELLRNGAWRGVGAAVALKLVGQI